MGNHQQLIDAIQQKLFLLPDDTVVIPGHGPLTTIGDEKRHNPFVADARFR
jgi:glyoxylase-like metal-dependent hydrolase (beta-lactamase superfamily II)